FANFFRTSANQLQLALQEKTQTVDGINVERVTHCDHKAALAERDRITLNRRASSPRISLITCGGMIIVEMSIQSMCACAASVRETSTSDRSPPLIKISITLGSPFRRERALSICLCVRSPPSWRTPST